MSREQQAAGWALATRLNRRMMEHPKRAEFQGATGCWGASGAGLESILLWGHPEAIADAVAAEGVTAHDGRVWSWPV